MNTRDFFNKKAATWDRTAHHDSKKLATIMKLIGLRKGNRVLDVGTGTGVLVPWISEEVGPSGFVVAVDVAEKMLEIAQKKFDNHTNVCFVRGDVLEDEVGKQFDAIICYSMFPHFGHRQNEALQRLSTLLNDKGKLVVCHSQSHEEINAIHQSSEGVKNDALPKASVLAEMMEKAGLVVEHALGGSGMYFVMGRKPAKQ